jgi:type II secretory pathway component GspD/PulD (secretin)
MRRLIVVLSVLGGLVVGGYVGAEEPPKGGEFAAPEAVPQRLIKVLRTTNKAETNRYVPKVYEFKNVNPFAVLRFFRRVMQIEEGGWFVFGKPEHPDDPDSVKSGKVVVVAPIYQLPYIDRLMAVIDTPGLTSSSGDVMLYYRPKHRDVADASFVADANAALSPNRTTTDQVPDTEVNGFLFYESPGGIANLQSWLPALDQPPPQVMVEATLYEVNVENDDALGLDFVSWKNGPGRDLFQAGAFFERERIPTLKGAPPLLDTGVPGGTFALPHHGWRSYGAYYSYFLDVPSEFFDFLVTKQKARVLTSAKVLTRNGRAAQLTAADVIFYWRRNEDADDVRIVVGDQRERVLGASSAGVILKVTPLIGSDGINMDILVDVVGNTGFDSLGTPQLVRRKYDTKLRVQDGQEIVLGGYTREMMVQQSNKVPFLGSLPIVGYLFGGEQNLVKQRRVVVVLSANVVEDFSAMTGTGTQIDAALIQARATQQLPVKNLGTEAGFDQWLLDPETAR